MGLERGKAWIIYRRVAAGQGAEKVASVMLSEASGCRSENDGAKPFFCSLRIRLLFGWSAMRVTPHEGVLSL
jgi:hypothetical protein